MTAGQWNEPISFETKRLGIYLTISTTAEAARVLLDHWPVDHGKAYKAAQAACLLALEGKLDPEAARLAFLKAAKEAGVFIRA